MSLRTRTRAQRTDDLAGSCAGAVGRATDASSELGLIVTMTEARQVTGGNAPRRAARQRAVRGRLRGRRRRRPARRRAPARRAGQSGHRRLPAADRRRPGHPCTCPPARPAVRRPRPSCRRLVATWSRDGDVGSSGFRAARGRTVRSSVGRFSMATPARPDTRRWLDRPFPAPAAEAARGSGQRGIRGRLGLDRRRVRPPPRSAADTMAGERRPRRRTTGVRPSSPDPATRHRPARRRRSSRDWPRSEPAGPDRRRRRCSTASTRSAPICPTTTTTTTTTPPPPPPLPAIWPSITIVGSARRSSSASVGRSSSPDAGCRQPRPSEPSRRTSLGAAWSARAARCRDDRRDRLALHELATRGRRDRAAIDPGQRRRAVHDLPAVG